MAGKKPNVPMKRIQERAPEEKFMENAQVVPSPIHSNPQRAIRTKQEAQLREMQDRLKEGPDVFDGYDAQAYERRTTEAYKDFRAQEAAESSQVRALEEKLAALEESLSEEQDSVEAFREQTKKLKDDLNTSRANEKRVTKQLQSEQADRRAEAVQYAENIAKAQARIEELETAKGNEVEEVEVEIYPNKILVQEIANVIRKSQTVILKTQVSMDDELVPMSIRIPFKKLKAAIDKVDRTPAEEEE